MSDHDLENIPPAVAIVGLSGRFPGAADVRQFWQNLREGVESITFFTDDELARAGVSPALLADRSYVKAGAILGDVEQFAASFFGYTPKEAEITDPQHRLFIECAWEALEDAGCVPDEYAGRIGVYSGAGMNTYMIRNLLPNRPLIEAMGVLPLVIGNKADFMSTQVSYKLNLTGPSVNVGTACSTSLVAVHLACRSLLNYECDMALAGGVTIQVPQKEGYLHQPGGVSSPDGHCRAFDARAEGTIGSSGAGVVILKRLEEALADGDHVYAVIRGSAINNDGSHKAGYTAPGIEGQKEVIATAMAVADVDPQTIGYVEAHGTGTTLGDPIEVRALTEAFRMSTDRSGFCAIGSVKPNVGHLDAAAGVASLIKTALCLEHRTLVPSILFEQPNPAIPFSTTPFYVNTALGEWKRTDEATPLRAGVSSFGIGGTNAHVVLEEAPAVARAPGRRRWKLLPLSAHTESALDRATQRLEAHLQRAPDCALDDVAYTLQVGRRSFGRRRVVLCRDPIDACTAIRERDPKRTLGRDAQADHGDASVVFLFPGIGDQYVDMAAGLYRDEPAFRRAVDRCAGILEPLLGLDLRELLYPADGASERERGDDALDKAAPFDLRALLNRGEPTESEHDSRLRRTIYAHPALFTIEYALAQLWAQWGVTPASMIGHSLGEYTAACVAGVMSLEDALTVVARRAQLIQALPEGGMLAVGLPAASISPMLNDGLSIAAINGPSLTVVAGPVDALADLARRLDEKDVAHRAVQSTHAFHSTMMEAIRAPLTALFAAIELKAPQIPYVSNVTGTWITEREATDPHYWAMHTCGTVRFGDGIATLVENGASIYLEAGPGQSLSSFVLQHPAVQAREDVAVAQSLPGVHDRVSDGYAIARALGSLWCVGKRVDWRRYHGDEKRLRVSLPTYPFERQRYWIEQPSASETPKAVTVPPLAPKPRELLYVPSWAGVRVSPPRAFDCLAERQQWLVFLDDTPVGKALLRRLRDHDQAVVVVRRGDGFECIDDGACVLDPARLSDYDALAQKLRESNALPRRVVHLWALCDQARTDAVGEAAIASGYSSLLCLARAFAEDPERQIELAVVSSGVHTVSGQETPCPEKAAVLGPCMVIPIEFPHIRCGNIDLAVPDRDIEAEAAVDAILHELDGGLAHDVVAYRGRTRWTRSYEPQPEPRVESERGMPALRDRGVYLITDYRPSGVSHLVAEYLAKHARATLALIVEVALPPRAEWQNVSPQDLEPAARDALIGITKLESLGATLVVVDGAGDGIACAFNRAVKQLAHIDGVIHTLAPSDYRLILFKDEARSVALSREVERAFSLMRALERSAIDFVAFFSSNLGSAGGAGQVDYCASNTFIRAFSDYVFAVRQKPTLSVALDYLDDDSVVSAPDAFPAALLKYIDTSRRRYAVGEEDAFEALSKIFADGAAQVAVSATDLGVAVREMRRDTLPTIVERLRGSAGRSGVGRGLRPPYVAPQTDVEQRVVEIWENLFGIEQIGVDDGFFALGGSSLLAVQLVSRLRESFQVEIPLRTLFQASSVRDLSGIVEDILLAEIEALTLDEVRQYTRDSQDGGAAVGVEATEYELPNKLVVRQFNPVETDHFYKDIFETQVYYRNGIELDEGSVVFDVGANIGLFSLFVHRHCRNPTIYAFEPAPPVFEALRSNTAANGVNAKLFNFGLSNTARTETFTFYPHSTGMSSFHADKAEEKEVLRAIMNNQLEQGMQGMQEVMAHAEDILAERFRDTTYQCELSTVSEMIRRHGIERIDLMKIDVQKAELEVMEGIEAGHWPRIRQLVVEIHDIDGRVEKVRSLLTSRGYHVVVEQDSLYRGSNISNLYAIRRQTVEAERSCK
jgi:FkbM family methyltransferase